MAGNTKSYKVTNVDGTLSKEVVDHSPKATDSIPLAVKKLSSDEKGARVSFDKWITLLTTWELFKQGLYDPEEELRRLADVGSKRKKLPEED